ncbi:hypothetical protein V8C86DRAFT_2750894 [Haematococcus lacustris]
MVVRAVPGSLLLLLLGLAEWAAAALRGGSGTESGSRLGTGCGGGWRVEGECAGEHQEGDLVPCPAAVWLLVEKTVGICSNPDSLPRGAGAWVARASPPAAATPAARMVAVALQLMATVRLGFAGEGWGARMPLWGAHPKGSPRTPLGSRVGEGVEEPECELPSSSATIWLAMLLSRLGPA